MSILLSLIKNLIIPSCEGRLIVCVEISRVDTKFIYAVKLVPPKNLGKYCSSRHYSLEILIMATPFTKIVGIICPDTSH